ncbi:hypothetical protein PU629_16905 [Pullulanibacillus sp. KACC 23026]|uniref:hypothetical protein n=1 Tax=Pullulanibacillus sp. KACC 23026 TaxID=3028315 RepID=UPI0023AE720F|nr:hypothetical protein [Pullulanibacillus sp. KACC 23026]WEG11805.1 hypothetical protein PU629_16905 [Pullulanibacillus sp. KACC 23026]
MEKFKAFVISLIYGISLALISWGITLLIQWGRGEVHSVIVSLYLFIAILVPCCLAIPAAGHVLVRQRVLSSKVIWFSSVCFALVVPWLAAFLYTIIRSIFMQALGMKLVWQNGDWTFFYFPLSLLFARLVIGLYLKLLERLGLLASFRAGPN